jgi:hypothetical protein
MSRSWVEAHGRRIEVETVEVKRRAKLTKWAHVTEAYALVPLSWGAQMAKCSKARHVMVWLVLAHLARKQKSATVSLSNEILKPYGVNKQMKYRALARLEAAGVIKLGRQGNQSLSVTLLAVPKMWALS